MPFSPSIGVVAPVAPAVKTGLFASLIGDARVMFYALLDKPENYEPGVAELLQEMVADKGRANRLTKDESALLDRAVLDFVDDKKPRPKIDAPVIREEPLALKKATEEDEELEFHEDGRSRRLLELPASAPTFWWRDATAGSPTR